jgi:hypothetical protein
VRVGAALVCVAAMSTVAAADEPSFEGSLDGSVYERLWPRVPDGNQLSLSQQIQDRLTLLGNTLGYHLDVLSRETLSLRFDGRRRRASVRLGAGEAQFLTFQLASDVHFTEGLARITTRVDLAVAGRALHLELPELEMTPTEYHGERGVVVRLPLLRRSF